MATQSYRKLNLDELREDIRKNMRRMSSKEKNYHRSYYPLPSEFYKKLNSKWAKDVYEITLALELEREEKADLKLKIIELEDKLKSQTDTLSIDESNEIKDKITELQNNITEIKQDFKQQLQEKDNIVLSKDNEINDLKEDIENLKTQFRDFIVKEHLGNKEKYLSKDYLYCLDIFEDLKTEKIKKPDEDEETEEEDYSPPGLDEKCPYCDNPKSRDSLNCSECRSKINSIRVREGIGMKEARNLYEKTLQNM